MPNVQALKDFQYDDTPYVREGQVFTLRGHRNDEALLRHRFVAPHDGVTVRDDNLGEFASEWQRDRARVAVNESDPAALRQTRQARVAEQLDGQRVFRQGY